MGPFYLEDYNEAILEQSQKESQMSSENESLVSRRGMLAKSAVAAAVLTAGAHGADQARSRGSRATRRGRGRAPIGLQLYSVRGECQRDLPGTVAAVAKKV